MTKAPTIRMLATFEETDGDALMAMQRADQEVMKRYLTFSYERLKPDDEPRNASQGKVRSRQPLDLSIPFSQPPMLMRWITKMEKELSLSPIGMGIRGMPRWAEALRSKIKRLRDLLTKLAEEQHGKDSR